MGHIIITWPQNISLGIQSHQSCSQALKTDTVAVLV